MPVLSFVRSLSWSGLLVRSPGPRQSERTLALEKASDQAASYRLQSVYLSVWRLAFARTKMAPAYPFPE